MNINLFSNKYKVRKLTEKDIPIIYKLCSGNIIYYTYCPPFVDKERIIEDMTELPPGKGREDKYYVGFFDGDQLIGVLDIIDGYPRKEIAYIGFFMTDGLLRLCHECICKLRCESASFFGSRQESGLCRGWTGKCAAR